jgi:hypothetical protein
MHPFLEKLERFTDEAIPYALILLAGVIIIEFFFEDLAEHYELYLMITT